MVITGHDVRAEDVHRVAREYERVEVHPEAMERMKKCRDLVEEKMEAREIMYGVNTGIGEFSEVILDEEQTRQFQKYLIYNHSAGIGKPLPEEIVRAAMVSRANCLANGYSGNRPVIAQTFVDMLNRRVTPVVCEKGSVGG
jgi:histidine ammonia-lyase